jgi:hypothetical protein
MSVAYLFNELSGFSLTPHKKWCLVRLEPTTSRFAYVALSTKYREPKKSKTEPKRTDTE